MVSIRPSHTLFPAHGPWANSQAKATGEKSVHRLPHPPYHIRNLHRLPQFGAGAETNGIDFPVSIPGLLDANGWLQKVLETVRLAGDALPLFSSQNRRSWKMTKMRGFSPLTRIAHIYIYLHTSLFYTAKGFLNASVEGFHKIQNRVIDAGYKIKTSNEDHGR